VQLADTTCAAGVYAAATHPRNNILQPDDLGGVGRYAIQAAVVSPAVNVLCVNVPHHELAPIVYTEWDNAIFNETGVGNQTIGYSDWQESIGNYDDDTYWGNTTEVDDIFKWGEEYGRRPPSFQMVSILKSSPFLTSCRELIRVSKVPGRL
jgi:hypothetical protein